MYEPELTPYEQEQQGLRNVARLILPIESKLSNLPKEQIEELVIWLKNIHNPSNPEDRDRDNWVPFYNRVEELRKLPEQINYQRHAIRSFTRAFYCCMGIGVLATLAFWGVVDGFYASLVLLIALPFLWRKALKSIHKTLLTAKEQEQRHLFTCIREARSVPELQTAGLLV
jgi:hypothetical protein